MTMAESRPIYIEDSDALKAFIEEASASPLLAIDTEFMREKTYYPVLCLVQVAYYPKESLTTSMDADEKSDLKTCIIDPIHIGDVSSLGRLLKDDRSVKIFHSGYQDLEILRHETGCVPANIFDVQIAAALLGQTQQAGLGSLVSSFLGVNIKKGDSFTDWARRPLADSQIEYAAEDVIYLPELYNIMSKKLKELGRLSWLDDEFASLVEKAGHIEDPFTRFRRLKKVNQLNRRQMAAAREVAAWREISAQNRNIPRKWILTDEQIVESCRREPKTIDDLFLVRGIRANLSTKDARKVLELMARAYASGPETWPEIEYQPSSERNVDAAVDLMTAYVRMRSKQEDIAMQTIASHNELVDVARGHCSDSPVMRGWRRKIVGDGLNDILSGRISLRLSDEGDLLVERNG